ncbi:MAG: ribosome biogenesis GTPase Der [Terriglobales bacterium]
MLRVAIVGRPNVGKSTLFNRLTRSRRAIVGDEPGITRDRIYGAAEWRGQDLEIVDTGGMMPEDPEQIPAAIFRQAQVALGEADAIFFIVDGRSALAAPDYHVARLLRRSGRPTALLVNKMDSAVQAADALPFAELGIEPLFAVSAEHGIGLDDALDWVLASGGGAEGKGRRAEGAGQQAGGAEPAAESPSDAACPTSAPERIPGIAIVGRPNAGKSTLLNCLLGEERAIVSEVAGTTRDTVDALLERAGPGGFHRYRLLDTAGIRRKGKTRLMAEKLSVVMARQHLRRSELALVMVDAAEGVVALDATIAGYASDSGRSVILVVNKWDLARARGLRRAEFERELRDHLKFLAYAPVVFISAARGEGLGALWQAIDAALGARAHRIPTAELNRFFARLDLDRAPTPRGQQFKIYYLSQVTASPPTFVLFVDKLRPLHFGLRRYLENQLRRAFGFTAAPLIFRLKRSGAPRRSRATSARLT